MKPLATLIVTLSLSACGPDTGSSTGTYGSSRMHLILVNDTLSSVWTVSARCGSETLAPASGVKIGFMGGRCFRDALPHTSCTMSAHVDLPATQEVYDSARGGSWTVRADEVVVCGSYYDPDYDASRIFCGSSTLDEARELDDDLCR